MTKATDASGPSNVEPTILSRLAEAVGPYYTIERIGRVLGHSEGAVAALVEGYCLLALTTADGVVVLPKCPLHNGQMVSGLPTILRMLSEGIDDPWTWALWLNSTPPVVDGIAPEVSRIQQLIDGEFDRVLRAAERAASSWRS